MPDLAQVQQAWIRTEIARQLRRAGISGSVVDAGHLTGAIPPDVGGGGGGAGTITVEEADGTPSVADVDTIKVSPGTLTDNADGSVTIDTGLVPSSYVVIEDATLAADAASWTSVPIDGAYEHLVVIWSGKCSAATGPVVGLRVNGDTAANYDTQVQEVSNITTSAFQAIGGTSIRVGLIPASSLADVWNGGRIEVIAIQSARQKAVMSRHARKDGTASGNIRIEQATGFWRGTAAITSVTLLALSDGFEQGSRFTLYGQLAAPLGGGGAVTSHDALTDVSANDHHAQAHLLTGADHTYSGLTAGDVLTALSATTAGFSALPAGMRVIADTLVGGAGAASVDITGLPSTAQHLLLIVYGRGDTAAATVTLGLRFNGDTGANYDRQRLTGSATTADAAEGFAGTSIALATSMPAASAPANQFGASWMLIPRYRGGNQKVLLGLTTSKGGVATGDLDVEVRAGFWRSNAAITQLTIFPASGNLVSGTVVTLLSIG